MGLTILDIARICHEAARLYLESAGERLEPWDKAMPPWQKGQSYDRARSYLNGHEIVPVMTNRRGEPISPNSLIVHGLFHGICKALKPSLDPSEAELLK